MNSVVVRHRNDCSCGAAKQVTAGFDGRREKGGPP